jgi:hypothetical protein
MFSKAETSAGPVPLTATPTNMTWRMDQHTLTCPTAPLIPAQRHQSLHGALTEEDLASTLQSLQATPAVHGALTEEDLASTLQYLQAAPGSGSKSSPELARKRSSLSNLLADLQRVGSHLSQPPVSPDRTQTATLARADSSLSIRMGGLAMPQGSSQPNMQNALSRQRSLLPDAETQRLRSVGRPRRKGVSRPNGVHFELGRTPSLRLQHETGVPRTTARDALDAAGGGYEQAAQHIEIEASARALQSAIQVEAKQMLSKHQCCRSTYPMDETIDMSNDISRSLSGGLAAPGA